MASTQSKKKKKKKKTYNEKSPNEDPCAVQPGQNTEAVAGHRTEQNIEVVAGCQTGQNIEVAAGHRTSSTRQGPSCIAHTPCTPHTPLTAANGHHNADVASCWPSQRRAPTALGPLDS